MTAPRQAFLLGQEITPLILDWGELDEIKSVLLAQQQMFAGQIKLKADNTAGLFAPLNPSSILFGKPALNQSVSIYLNGVEVFQGVLKDVEMTHNAYDADLVIENSFSKIATTLVLSQAAGVNPALAILNLLQTYGFSNYVNAASFQAAAGPAQAAGAVISLNYTLTGDSASQTYLLDAINAIADFASLIVYVQNNIIYCTTWREYQGNGSGLRQEISAPYVRSWGTRKTAYNTFYNQVTVPYGASASVTVNNFASQVQTNTQSAPVNQSFSTSTGTTAAFSVAGLASATFFATQYLNRASVIREEINIQMGSEFADAVIGYRYPVTIPLWGYLQKAFEVIESKRTLADKGIELTLASI